jgi:type III pantothenate kinase
LILGLDIGNTNIEIGLLSEEFGSYEISHTIRFFTRLNITSDEFGIFILNFLYLKKIDPKQVKALIYSSVVPPLNGKIVQMYENYFSGKIIEVNEKTNIGIKNCYKNPKEVGSDRLVNAVAVNKLYKKDAIIVDMGTATTFCALSSNGNYYGGAIIPGISISTQALTERASRLPAINIQKKEKLLWDDTASAIEAGVYYENYFALKGICEQLANEMKFKNYIKVGSGGYISIFKDDNIFDVIDYSLTLKGLKIIYDLNKS